MEDRMNIVKDLALLRGGVIGQLEKLSAFEWDFNGVPFTLKGVDVANILTRFLENDLSSEELEIWADAIEVREDIQFDQDFGPWIDEVITTLSSPEINGPITKGLVEDLLKKHQDA